MVEIKKKQIPEGRRFTSETARAMGSKGGKRSQAVQRFARTFREAAMKALDEVKQSKDKQGNMVDYVAREEIVNSLIRESIKGNVRAAELLMKVAGESPTEKLEVTGAGGKDLFTSKTDTELKSTLDALMEKLGKC